MRTIRSIAILLSLHLASGAPAADGAAGSWNPLVIGQRVADLKRRAGDVRRRLTDYPELLPSLQTHERIGFHGHRATPAWVQIDLGTNVVPDEVFVFPARMPVVEDVPSPGFPSALIIEVSDDESFGRGVRIADWAESESGAGCFLPFLRFSGNGAGGRFLRVRVMGFRRNPAQREEEYYRLGEIVVVSRGRNAALRRPVTTTRSTDTARRWEPMNLTDGFLWCLPLRGKSGSPANGYHSALEKRELVSGAQWVEVDFGEAVVVDELHLVPAHPPDFPDSAGFGFPPRFWITADFGLPTERELLRETDPPYPAEALPNPGAAAVMISPIDGPMQRIRVTCETLWRRGVSGGRADYFFALGELLAWRGGSNVARGRSVRFADRLDTDRWRPQALVDGFSSRHELLGWSAWLDGVAERHALETELSELEGSIAELEQLLGARWRGLAIMATLFIGVASGLALLLMRRRAARSREALRSQIARDLHDEIGASLSHLAMQCELAGRQLGSGKLERSRLDSLAGAARETLDNMRDIVWLLAPVGGDWENLSARIEAIGQRLLSGCQHELEVIGERPPGEPPIQWARDLVAFFKEALTNTRRHSGANRVEVKLIWTTSRLTLEVRDDGTGFDPGEASLGSGLHNLRVRANQLGANFDLRSQPGEGTAIVLSVPLPK